MGHSEYYPAAKERRPWNAGRMVGAKRALKPQQVWAIRFWLDVIQQKTGRPVQFELLESARGSILAWLERRGGTIDEFAFPSRIDPPDHISTRQYARLVDEWVTAIGLRAEDYGTHSLRRTKASIIYKQTGNLRAVQICSATRKSRAPFDTWASMSRMRSRLLKARRYNIA